MYISNDKRSSSVSYSSPNLQITVTMRVPVLYLECTPEGYKMMSSISPYLTYGVHCKYLVIAGPDLFYIPYLVPSEHCQQTVNQCSESMTFWCGSRSWSDPRTIPLTNGSGSRCGSRSCYFHHWPSRGRQKTNFFIKFFLFINFWRYIYIIFQR